MLANDRTGIRIPPPFLFLGPFIVGWFITLSRPWRLLEDGAVAVAIGVALAGAGLNIAVLGVCQFTRARTTVLPFGGTSRIVEAGIYKLTRNPMYLGMAFAYAGCAFLVNSPWCLAFMPIAIVLVQVLAIEREEQYLAEKFGHVYGSYRSRVRRWI